MTANAGKEKISAHLVEPGLDIGAESQADSQTEAFSSQDVSLSENGGFDAPLMADDKMVKRASELLAQDFTIFDLMRARKLAVAEQPPAADKDIDQAAQGPDDAFAGPGALLEDPAAIAPTAQDIRQPAPSEIVGKQPFWLAPVKSFLATFVILFAAAWIFVLGLVVGRGSLWLTGPGQSVAIWVDEFLGIEAPAPPLVEVAENIEPVVSPPSAPQAPEDDWGEDDIFSQTTITKYYYNDPDLALYLPGQPLPGARAESGPSTDPLSPSAPGPSAQISGLNQPALTSTLGTGDGELWPRPPQGEGNYAVQAAWRKIEAEAEGEVTRLINKGFEAYYYKNSQGRFMVRVGRYKTVAEAEVIRKKLSDMGYVGPYISKLQGAQ